MRFCRFSGKFHKNLSKFFLKRNHAPLCLTMTMVEHEPFAQGIPWLGLDSQTVWILTRSQFGLLLAAALTLALRHLILHEESVVFNLSSSYPPRWRSGPVNEWTSDGIWGEGFWQAREHLRRSDDGGDAVRYERAAKLTRTWGVTWSDRCVACS